MSEYAPSPRPQINTEIGYEDPFNEASLSGLMFVTIFGAALFFGFAVFDSLTHPKSELLWRLAASILPGLTLGAIGLVTRAGRISARYAPIVAASAATIAMTSPLLTIAVSTEESRLIYILLIMIIGSTTIYTIRPFIIMIFAAGAFYALAISFVDFPNGDPEEWVAALIVGIGLAVTILISQRSSVRRYADAESQLTFLAGHDQLTELLNRHGLENGCVALIALAQREKRSVFATFIDIDGLSNINNTHGHSTGDHLIFEVGVALKSLVRSADLVARWGGDEIVIIGIGDGPEPERIEAAVRKHVELSMQIPNLNGSVSVGSISLEAADTSIAALIQAADAQMYERREERRAAGS